MREEIRGTQDAAVNHLLDIVDGGRERRQREDAAVRRLLEADPKNGRETSHRDNDAVQFLAGLTMAELRKQGR